VRVTAPSLDLDKGVGTVAALETDTLVVNTEQRADALEVPLADVTKLEVHRGQKSKTGTSALIGAGFGAALGVSVALIGCADNECLSDGDATAGVAVLLGAGGALLGAGLGALIGSGTKVDRWETVPLDDIRVGPSPVTPDGVAVSVTLRLRL
jgi:hypothetical protein